MARKAKSQTRLKYNTSIVFYYTLASFSPEKLRKDIELEAIKNGTDHYKMLDLDLNVGTEEMRARMVPARRDIKSRKLWLTAEMTQIIEAAAAKFDLPAESIMQAYESCFACMTDAVKTYDFPTMVIPGLGSFYPRRRRLESYKARLEASYISSLNGKFTAKLLTPESYRRRAIAIQLALDRMYHERGLWLDPMTEKRRPVPSILWHAYRELRPKDLMKEINQRFLKPLKKDQKPRKSKL